jgi:hypothetical protein
VPVNPQLEKNLKFMLEDLHITGIEF